MFILIWEVHIVKRFVPTSVACVRMYVFIAVCPYRRIYVYMYVCLHNMYDMYACMHNMYACMHNIYACMHMDGWKNCWWVVI